MNKKTQTALEAFEAERDAIFRLLAKIPQNLTEYDRDISSVRGGHQDWSHAGTMKHVREQLEGALESLTSARQNTRSRAARRAKLTARNVPVSKDEIEGSGGDATLDRNVR